MQRPADGRGFSPGTARFLPAIERNIVEYDVKHPMASPLIAQFVEHHTFKEGVATTLLGVHH